MPILYFCLNSSNWPKEQIKFGFVVCFIQQVGQQLMMTLKIHTFPESVALWTALLPLGSSFDWFDLGNLPPDHCLPFPQDSFLLSFSLENMACSMPPNCLLSTLLCSHCFQIENTTYRSSWCTSGICISCTQSKRNTSLPLFSPFLLQNKLCVHDKYTKHAEVWVKLIYLIYL